MYSIIVIQTFIIGLLIGIIYKIILERNFYKDSHDNMIKRWIIKNEDIHKKENIFEEMRHIIRKFKGRE